MALPAFHGTGRLTADPELRFAPSGTAVATAVLAFNSRKKDTNGEWIDGDSFFVRATAFRETAENMAESLTKGAEINVTGRLKTDEWQDKETGAKRTAPSLLVDSIGPNLRSATARIAKTERGGTTATGQTDDPWGSAPAGGQADEPPF